MKIAAIALSAALLGLMSISPASAATALTPSAVKAATQQQASGVELVQRKKYRDRRSYRQRYRAGQRYRSAPRGWRRYDRRPSYWRTRGCVIVGPVWFCP